MLLGLRYYNAYSIPLIVIVGVGIGVGLIDLGCTYGIYGVEYIYNYSLFSLLPLGRFKYHNTCTCKHSLSSICLLVKSFSTVSNSHIFKTTSSSIPFEHEFIYNSKTQELFLNINYLKYFVCIHMACKCSVVNNKLILPFNEIIVDDISKLLNGVCKRNTLNIIIEEDVDCCMMRIFYYDSFTDPLNKDNIKLKLNYELGVMFQLNGIVEEYTLTP